MALRWSLTRSLLQAFTLSLPCQHTPVPFYESQSQSFVFSLFSLLSLFVFSSLRRVLKKRTKPLARTSSSGRGDFSTCLLGTRVASFCSVSVLVSPRLAVVQGAGAGLLVGAVLLSWSVLRCAFLVIFFSLRFFLHFFSFLFHFFYLLSVSSLWLKRFLLPSRDPDVLRGAFLRVDRTMGFSTQTPVFSLSLSFSLLSLLSLSLSG